jgi:hypothetical protein
MHGCKEPWIQRERPTARNDSAAPRTARPEFYSPTVTLSARPGTRRIKATAACGEDRTHALTANNVNVMQRAQACERLAFHGDKVSTAQGSSNGDARPLRPGALDSTLISPNKFIFGPTSRWPLAIRQLRPCPSTVQPLSHSWTRPPAVSQLQSPSVTFRRLQTPSDTIFFPVTANH